MPDDSLHEHVEEEVRTLLAQYAITHSDAFRQWYYPDLPTSDAVNPEVDRLIEHGIAAGKPVEQIVSEIVRARA